MGYAGSSMGYFRVEWPAVLGYLAFQVPTWALLFLLYSYYILGGAALASPFYSFQSRAGLNEVRMQDAENAMQLYVHMRVFSTISVFLLYIYTFVVLVVCKLITYIYIYSYIDIYIYIYI